MSEAVNVKSPVKHINKLVRDKIPEIIEASGQECKYDILTDDVEYISALEAKLWEEINEYLVNHSIEELFDIIDVLLALVDVRKCEDEIEDIGQEKTKTHGNFSKRIYLKCVYPKGYSE